MTSAHAASNENELKWVNDWWTAGVAMNTTAATMPVMRAVPSAYCRSISPPIRSRTKNEVRWYMARTDTIPHSGPRMLEHPNSRANIAISG